VSYFQAVRLYALLESLIFGALLVVWLGEVDEGAKTVLGWVHGFGWILLSVLVLYGWLRRIFPGPLLAATVSPAGPLGALVGFEVLVRRGRDTGTVGGDVPSERAEHAHPAAHPAGASARGGAARGDAERVGGGRGGVRRGGDH
jgi:uncharacterized membrane protein